jgi:hypothetical protein
MNPKLASTLRNICSQEAQEHVTDFVKSFLNHPDLLAATKLSDEQVIQLTSLWNSFKLRYQEAVGMVLKSIEALKGSLDGAPEFGGTALNWGVDSNGSESSRISNDPGHITTPFCKLATSNLSAGASLSILEDFCKAEERARVELLSGAMRILSTMQKAHMWVTTMPNIISTYHAMLKLERDDFKFALPSPLETMLRRGALGDVQTF